MTKYTCSELTLTELERRARSGNISDIDYLMENLEVSKSFVHCKMIDYEVLYIDKKGNRRDYTITSTDVRTAINNMFELVPSCKRIISCKPKPMFD